MSLINISDKIISKEFEILSARNLKLKLDKFRLQNELEFKFKKTINWNCGQFITKWLTEATDGLFLLLPILKLIVEGD